MNEKVKQIFDIELGFSYVVNTKIKKIPQKPKLTNKDKIAIKFLKNCGFHYLVKLENMPDKVTVSDREIVWAMNDDNYYFPDNVFDMPISHKEPLCLDDFSEEDLKED